MAECESVTTGELKMDEEQFKGKLRNSSLVDVGSFNYCKAKLVFYQKISFLKEIISSPSAVPLTTTIPTIPKSYLYPWVLETFFYR